MPIDPTPTTCGNCGGDGIDNGGACLACMGSGSLPLSGLQSLLHKMKLEKMDDILDKLVDIKEKVDEIKEKVDTL